MKQDKIEGPSVAKAAFIAWMGGGRQEFPNDPMLDRVRYEQLKREGKIISRRRAA